MAKPTVRVGQLATTMREPVQQTIERLRTAGVEVHSARDAITHEQAEQALSGIQTAAQLSTARDLIIDAYAAARESGREDWNVMTPAVLKNRLLDATERGFDENEYGAPTFAYFVSLFPDLLSSEVVAPGHVLITIDEDAVRPQAAIVPEGSQPHRMRIREDLWRAFGDFSSPDAFVWDVERGVALAGAPGDGYLEIPTLTPQEESGWRASFAAKVAADLREHEQSALEEWRDRRLPSVSLPPRLRGVWNGLLRERMVAKIEQFFNDAQLSVPDDVLVAPSHAAPRDDQRSRSVDDGGLRAFVRECVELMTPEELNSLALPMSVIVRAHAAGSK